MSAYLYSMKRLKSFSSVLMLSGLLFLLGTSTSSCKVKEGCDVEHLKAPVDKNGNLSTKRGSSSLFDKKRVAKSKKRKSNK